MAALLLCEPGSINNSHHGSTGGHSEGSGPIPPIQNRMKRVIRVAIDQARVLGIDVAQNAALELGGHPFVNQVHVTDEGSFEANTVVFFGGITGGFNDDALIVVPVRRERSLQGTLGKVESSLITSDMSQGAVCSDVKTRVVYMSMVKRHNLQVKTHLMSSQVAELT